MAKPADRTYPNTDWRNHDVVTMSMPRYMFYATQVTDKDIGGGRQHVLIAPGIRCNLPALAIRRQSW